MRDAALPVRSMQAAAPLQSVQSLAIAASPLHAASQRFQAGPPSVDGLALDLRCKTVDVIGQ